MNDKCTLCDGVDYQLGTICIRPGIYKLEIARQEMFTIFDSDGYQILHGDYGKSYCSVKYYCRECLTKHHQNFRDVDIIEVRSGKEMWEYIKKGAEQ
jgi:hypothetical protein